MAQFTFVDHSEEVKAVMSDVAMSALEEACGELETQVKRNQDRFRDSGDTTNSWQHRVSQNGDAYEGNVGSDYMNAIWEEFGTGRYAEKGNGRKGGWAYEDEKTGETIWTHGKKPRRHFRKAYDRMKNKLIRFIQNSFKGGFS